MMIPSVVSAERSTLRRNERRAVVTVAGSKRTTGLRGAAATIACPPAAQSPARAPAPDHRMRCRPARSSFRAPRGRDAPNPRPARAATVSAPDETRRSDGRGRRSRDSGAHCPERLGSTRLAPERLGQSRQSSSSIPLANLRSSFCQFVSGARDDGGWFPSSCERSAERCRAGNVPRCATLRTTWIIAGTASTRGLCPCVVAARGACDRCRLDCCARAVWRGGRNSWNPARQAATVHGLSGGGERARIKRDGGSGAIAL